MRALFRYHDTIGYLFIPGLTARIMHESGGYLVRVNSLGFRSNREFDAKLAPGRKRILLFGDSFTAGDGVANEHRFSDLIEQLLDDVEVYNFGLPATGTDQQYLACRTFATSIAHDLVAIAIYVDNIRRVASGYRPILREGGAAVAFAKPYFELDGDRLTLRNVPVPHLRPAESELSPQATEALERIKHRGRSVADAEPLPEYHDPEHEQWRIMRAILEEWIRGHPRPVILVPLPLYQHIEGETCSPAGYRKRLGEIQSATGCRLYDPLDDLRRYAPAERRAFRFERDIHFTRAGHSAVARSIAPALAAALRETGRRA